MKTKARGGLKLNYRNTFMIGFGFLASSLVWSIYNAFVPLLLEQRFLLSTATIGTIMTIDNFFGVIFQPLVGALSDRTITKRGRRMPWIIVGLPICAILFAFIPRMRALGAMMAVIVIFNLVMSLWRSPVIALMPDVTPKSLRSLANGVINLMGGIGAIVAFGVGGALAKVNDTLPFLMGSILMLFALAMLVIFVREPIALKIKQSRGLKFTPREMRLWREAQEHKLLENTIIENKEDKVSGKDRYAAFKALSGTQKRSLMFLLLAILFWFCAYNAIETFFTLYATNVLGVSDGSASQMLTAFSLSFVAFALPAGMLAEKIGRKRTILIGLTGLVVVFIPALRVTDTTLLLILLLVGGVFWSCVNINSLPMVVELATSESIGAFTGYYYFFSFSAAIVSPILFGWIRDVTEDYSTLFIYSVIAFAIALVMMIFVKHGDHKLADDAPKEA